MAIVATVDRVLLDVLHDVHGRIQHCCRVWHVLGLVRENDRSWKVTLLIIEVVSLIGLFVKGGFKTSRTLNL